jgi:hypothetical protein
VLFNFHMFPQVGLSTSVYPSPLFGFVMGFTGANQSQSASEVLRPELEYNEFLLFFLLPPPHLQYKRVHNFSKMHSVCGWVKKTLFYLINV